MTYFSPRWSGEILDCSMPLTFDTYDVCSYNCLYCFSFFQKSHTMSGSYQKKGAEAVKVETIKRLFALDDTLPVDYRQFFPYIRDRITMQWGGLADQFDMNEKEQGKTLELLKFFKEINYPLCFSTKATWWTKDERYIELFRDQDNWNTKISIICLDEKRAKRMELGVPSPRERLDAMAKLSKLNKGGTTLRLRPFIIGLSNKDNDHIELIKLAAEAGAGAVSTEFFCLERRADERLLGRYKQMSDLLGFDILKFYTEHSRGSGYSRLNYEIKKKYIYEMRDQAEASGLRFYVSDAHHKEKCHNGSCCGLPPTWKYARGQFTEALVLAKKNGRVTWAEMEPHLEMFKDIRWVRALGFNTTGAVKRAERQNQSLYDYIREIWNSPNSAKSPYKYFGGVMHPIGLDDNKNVIYEYRPKD